MTPPLRERLADTITGGQLSEARKAVTTLKGQYNEVLSETRKLSRDLDTLKEGGMLTEDYAGCDWTSRLHQDQQWLLISGYAQHRQIQKSDVDLYHDLMNYAYMFSPLIRGAIDLKTRYTFGLKYTIQSEKNQDAIDAITDDPRNRLAFFGSQAIIEADHELQKGGNIYIAIWWKAKPVQVRVWSAYEIGDIITDPEDADLPMFYVRSMEDGTTKVYPSLFNKISFKERKTREFLDIPTDKDKIKAEIDPNIVVYHMAEGKGLKQKWALSPYTPALRWNRAYEQFLLDFAAIVQAIRKYAYMFTTQGGDATVTALKTQFDHEQHGRHKTQIADGIIATEGNDFKVIDAGNSKIVGLSDSRQYLMQFCTATGIPENMLTGNPMTGNRASAQELTANFLPLIEERQTMWTDAFKVIFTRMLENDEFEISFPPLRSQDALTYLQSLTATAMTQTGTLTGLVRPEDLIRAVYESLDLKIPEKTDIEEMVAAILEKVNQNPDMAQAIDRLVVATEQMKGIMIKA